MCFMKNIEESYQTVLPLLEHPSPEIRKGAVVAIGHFCVAVGQAAQTTQDTDAQTGSRGGQ